MDHLLAVIWLLLYPIIWETSNYIEVKKHKINGQPYPEMTIGVALFYFTMYFGVAKLLW